MSGTTMDVARVRGILPHRFPIAMVDRVLDLVPGKSLTAIKCISANEACFEFLQDGAPGARCLYPQSLLIESFLQAAGLLFVESVELPSAGSEMVMLFGSLSGCEFPGDAFPGDVVVHHVRTQRLLSDSAVLCGESMVGDMVIARFDQAVVAIRPKALLDQGPAQ